MVLYMTKDISFYQRYREMLPDGRHSAKEKFVKRRRAGQIMSGEYEKEKFM